MLVDYSKRRAEIGSPDESHASFSWNSEVEGHHDSFACEFQEVEEEKNSSLRTLSTASVESSSSNLSASGDLDELSSHMTTEAPVSFRIKRSSMSHTAAVADTSALRVGPGDAASSSARFHDSLPTDWKLMNTSSSSNATTNTAPVSKVPISTELNMKLVAKPAPYRRNATSPARINSSDSLHCRLQYAAWKKKQKSLLSASAVIATSSDRDLYDNHRRRSSLSKAGTQNLTVKEEGELLEVSPMATSKPKIGRHGSHHNLGYGLGLERTNSTRRSSSRRRRVTMSHVNNPPSETTIPAPQPSQDLGYVPQQEAPPCNSISTRRSRRRCSSSLRGGEAVPALEGLPPCSTDLLGYGEDEPEQTITTPRPRYSKRRVTMTHVNHPPECDIPGPPALEPRRTCEMDALQALCGRRGGSFHSSMSRRTTTRGMDAPNKPPSPKYSRRRVSMSHVNNPCPTERVDTPLKRASTAPVRISEVSIRSNSEHSRRPRPRRKASMTNQQQQHMQRSSLLQTASFHGGSSSSLSRRLGYRRQVTPPQAGGPRLTRRHTRDVTTTSGGGGGRPTLADTGKSQSFRRASVGAQRTASSSGARAAARRTSSSILMSSAPSTSLGYRRQGTPPEIMSSSSSFRNGSGRRSLLSSSSFHGSRRNNSNGSLRDYSDNNHNNTGMQEQAPSPPRRTTSRRLSMANFGTTTASSSGNNLNDFVTGSRIRRLA